MALTPISHAERFERHSNHMTGVCLLRAAEIHARRTHRASQGLVPKHSLEVGGSYKCFVSRCIDLAYGRVIDRMDSIRGWRVSKPKNDDGLDGTERQLEIRLPVAHPAVLSDDRRSSGENRGRARRDEVPQGKKAKVSGPDPIGIRGGETKAEAGDTK